MLHNEQLPSQKYVHKMDILCFEQEDSSVSGVLPGPWYTCGFLNYDKIWPNWLNWCVSIFPSCNTRVHNMWTQLLPIILILIVLGLANMVTFLFVDFLQHFVLTISFFLFGLVSVCQLVDWKLTLILRIMRFITGSGLGDNKQWGCQLKQKLI